MSTLALLALVATVAAACALIVIRRDRGGDQWECFRPLTNEERFLRWADRLAEHEAQRRRKKALQSQRVAQRLDHRAAERIRAA